MPVDENAARPDPFSAVSAMEVVLGRSIEDIQLHSDFEEVGLDSVAITEVLVRVLAQVTDQNLEFAIEHSFAVSGTIGGLLDSLCDVAAQVSTGVADQLVNEDTQR